MNYSKDQINDMLANLKPDQKDEHVVSFSILCASNMSSYCEIPNGEDLFTNGCEDARI